VVDYLRRRWTFPPVKGINPDDESFIERKASDEEPFSALIFQDHDRPLRRPAGVLRVYSGHVESGTAVANTTKGNNERIGRPPQDACNKREEIKECGPVTSAPQWDCEACPPATRSATKDNPIVLETMNFPEPVIAVAIEPKTKADQEKMAWPSPN